MKAQTLSGSSQMGGSFNKRIMEINASNSLMKSMNDSITRSNTIADSTIDNTIRIMYDTSLIDSGYTHRHSSKFVECIYTMIGCGLGISEPSDSPGPEKASESESESDSVKKQPAEDDMEEVD
jgi:heat shock protein beta